MRHIFRGMNHDAMDPRRGNVLILFAALLPVTVGGMALSVDLGVIGTGKAQLQAAADSAALEGAARLAFNREGIPAATLSSRAISSASARLTGSQVLQQNISAGLTQVQVLPSGDGVSVQAQHPIAPVFAKLFGAGNLVAQASATARAEPLHPAPFTSVGGDPVNLLPIVLDKSTYQAMLAGTTTDQYRWNTTLKRVDSGSDGIEESKLYPVKDGLPGNWGTVKIGVSNNSTSVLGDQIRNGITPAQMATFPNSTIQLDYSLTPPSITFEGNPGISAGIKDDLTSIIGKPVFVPIYDQSGGNGNNAWYRVVAFAGARILDVDFKGNPKYVIIQPAQVPQRPAAPYRKVTGGSLDQGYPIRLHLTQ